MLATIQSEKSPPWGLVKKANQWVLVSEANQESVPIHFMWSTLLAQGMGFPQSLEVLDALLRLSATGRSRVASLSCLEDAFTPRQLR